MQETSALELVDSFEAKFDVAAMRFTAYDMPPWAYIRVLLAQVAADRLAGTTYYAESAQSRRGFGSLAYVTRTLLELPRSLMPSAANVLIFGSGAGNVRTPTGFHNRLVDHFAQASSAAVYEDSHAREFARPRSLPGLRYHDPLRALAAVAGKIRILPRRDADVISELLARVYAHFGGLLLPSDIAMLQRSLVNAARRMPFWHALYHRLFERVRPRLCLVEDACYGPHTHLLAWARNADITTAEYQHGYTYAQHPAYRLSPPLHDPRWAQYLPQHFLAWGEYWIRHLRLPIKSHVIGFPDLTERCRTLKQASVKRSQVLFVSSGLDIRLYRSVLVELGSAAGNRYSLVFRPHPGERATALQRYGEITSRNDWRLDLESDPYTSFAKSILVVGDISTAMFEALEFECPVVLIDTPLTRKLMPESIFPFSKQFDDLAVLLAAGQRASSPRRELWADNWKDRFRHFLTNHAFEQRGP